MTKPLKPERIGNSVAVFVSDGEPSRDILRENFLGVYTDLAVREKEASKVGTDIPENLVISSFAFGAADRGWDLYG